MCIVLFSSVGTFERLEITHEGKDIGLLLLFRRVHWVKDYEK